MHTLQDKVLFITGASRGIGLAIALRAARDGAKIAIAAKTVQPHARLPGTIHTAADEIRAAGGQALPIACDIRFAEQIDAAVARTVETFGGIDICINNASAISLTTALATPLKTFDLMNQINYRGAWLTSCACLPHLLQAQTPHILNISPPFDFERHWFKRHTAYSISKLNMSLVALGLAAEFEGRVAVNALWPQTAIATAAIMNLGGQDMLNASRKPEIMADAAYAVLTKGLDFTGRFLIDELFLRSQGVADFAPYAFAPGTRLQTDLFVEPDLFDD